MQNLRMSIFTPTHNHEYIWRAYETLQKQIYSNWEWIVILNSGCPDITFNDSRVKIFRYEQGSNIVGALKHYACEKATGDILVELDHDDMLTPDCLLELNLAFQDSNVDFAYSDCASVNQNWENHTYSEIYGWRYEDFEYEGHKILSAISPEPNPQSISRIWYAPNHVRAWRRDFYFKIGGHDKTLFIADDQDLMLRTYIHGTMHHIHKCLYIYWVSGNNTWLKYAGDIDIKQWECYDKYIMPMAEKWTLVNNLTAIDIDGLNGQLNYITIGANGTDIPCNLNERWPLEDNSVGLLKSTDVFANCKDPIHVMNEAWRVLAHGGFLFIEVPSTDGRGAWCNPKHISYWNERSFRYYTEATMRKSIEPECICRFLDIKTRTVNLYDNIPFVRAHLIALKDNGFLYHGYIQI